MRIISKYVEVSKQANIVKLPNAVAVVGADWYGVRKVRLDNLRGRCKDGSIKGLSVNALCRLRKAIASTTHADGEYRVYGVCLTIPWGTKDNPPSQEVGAMLWREFNAHLNRLSDKLRFGAIYRVELQQRTAVHWHLMVYIPNNLSRSVALRTFTLKTRKHIKGAFEIVSTKTRKGRPMIDVGSSDEIAQAHNFALLTLRWEWVTACYRVHDALSLIGEHGAPTACAVGVSGSLCDIKSFDYCFQCIPLEGVKSGIAYLATHTAKHKQEQLGYIGKQWGYIGQKHLHQDDGRAYDGFTSLTKEQRAKVLRLVRNWAKHNRPDTAWRVMKPRRKEVDGGYMVYNGLTIRTHSTLYLFGVPDSVFESAIRSVK